MNIFLGGNKIATIVRTHRGYQLDYDQGATLLHPLSQSLNHQVSRQWQMPVRRYKGEPVWEGSPSPLGNFLFGLLPDNPDVLSAMSQRYRTEDRNPAELLAEVGMDCVGAVQFSNREDLSSPSDSPARPTLISDSDIEQTLSAARARGVRYDGAAQGAEGDDGRYRPGSLLAGFQPKFGLLRRDDRWLRSTPEVGTTHIFKTGMAGREGQAALEFVGMRSASTLHLRAAEVDFLEFGSEHALVVKRFDRLRVDGLNALQRTHQEDLAQMMSVPVFPASKKYGRDGKRIIKALLRLEGGREIAHQFVQQLAYNTLIGNADAHLKNYSIQYDPSSGTPSLCPLYDCATDVQDPRFSSTAAVPIRIGGTTDYSALQRTSTWWKNLCSGTGLDTTRVMDEVVYLAKNTPEAALSAANELPETHRQRVLSEGALEAIADICENVEKAFRQTTALPSAGAKSTGLLPTQVTGMRARDNEGPRAVCGQVMPRANKSCIAPAGHRGPHRSR